MRRWQDGADRGVAGAAKERGWVDMYQPSDEFAAFLGTERPRIEGILKQVGSGEVTGGRKQ